MEIEEAKKELIEQYRSRGLTEIEEHEEGIYLQYRGTKYRISKDDIGSYARIRKRYSEFKVIPFNCSICSSDYREQAVVPLLGQQYPFGIMKKELYIFGDENDDSVYITIGKASNDFVNYFRFDEDFFNGSHRSIFRSNIPVGRIDVREMQDRINRIMTIRIYNIKGRNIEEAEQISSSYIEDCMFQMSYLKDFPFRILENWPWHQDASMREPFIYDDSRSVNKHPLPRARYSSDLIRFYQLGVSSDIPVLQFLTFYQVLEYYFVRVSDEKLYKRMASRINNPNFSAIPERLDSLIQDVINHRKTSDETEMLKGVIEQYVNENEIVNFIKAYEKYLGEKIYTKKRKRFGVELEVKLDRGHVIGNVSKVVKTIRNALVHSSDHHERTERHVPFSESTKIVRDEIPLVRFLAERVIIGSAKSRE